MTEAEPAELKRRVQAPTTSQRDAQRARIILACAEESIAEAAKRCGVSTKAVDQCREAVLKFVEYWNQRLARPFRWTFKGYPLQTGMDWAAMG